MRSSNNGVVLFLFSNKVVAVHIVGETDNKDIDNQDNNNIEN